MGKSTTTKTRAVFKASNTRFVQGLCRSGTVGGPAKSLHIRILKRKASPGASSGALSGKPRETGPPIGPLGSSSSEPANRESGSTHGSTHIKTNVQLPLHNSKRETGEVKRGFDLGTPKTHFFWGTPWYSKKVTLGV